MCFYNMPKMIMSINSNNFLLSKSVNEKGRFCLHGLQNSIHGLMAIAHITDLRRFSDQP